MSKEIKEKDNKELATIDYSQHAGEGTDFDQEDLSTPFLKVLQKNSPQVDSDNAAYVEGAKAGMFYNTALNEVYESPIQVLPCAYKRDFLKWTDINSGGGFHGSVSPDEALSLDQDDRGRYIIDNDTYVEDTRIHFVLHMSDAGPQPVIMSLSSSMIKASKNWNNIAKNLKLGPAGAQFPAPLFSHTYSAESTAEAKDSYTWKGLKVSKPVLVEDASLFTQAADFAKIVKDGEAVVDHAKHNGAEAAPSQEEESDEF